VCLSGFFRVRVPLPPRGTIGSVKNGRRLTLILAALAALQSLYIGSHLALVQRTERDVGFSGELRFAYYRFGGETAKRVFAPLHAIDQRLRKRH
jgi:hypothetical protein